MHTHFAEHRRHFEKNAQRPLPRVVLPEATPHRALLSASLARFQLGETGEGRIAQQIDRAVLPGVDADYRAALKLFVKEEGRHARILAEVVRGLGGELLHATTSSRLFTYGRRLAGIRLKLLVLLVAEVVSIVCYQTLAARLEAGELRDAVAQIAGDERHHLRFHMIFFRLQTDRSRAARALFSALVWMIGVCATVTVIVDHGPLFRALGTTRRRVAKNALRMIGVVERGVARQSSSSPSREGLRKPSLTLRSRAA